MFWKIKQNKNFVFRKIKKKNVILKNKTKEKFCFEKLNKSKNVFWKIKQKKKNVLKNKTK